MLNSSLRTAKLTINDIVPEKGFRAMKLRELADAFGQFNPRGKLTVSIPRIGSPPVSRSVLGVGHLDHPGEIKTDVGVHMIDIICDHWDAPDTSGQSTDPRLETAQDLLDAIRAFPDEMGCRVALPLSAATYSHRMLDIYSVGILVGAPAAGIQIVTENFDNQMQIIREFPEAVKARLAEAERLAETQEQ